MTLLIVASGIIFLMLVGVVLYLAVLIDLVAGKEDFATSGPVTNQIVQIIKDRKLDHGNFYDLGSARGGFALKIAKALPDWEVFGIDDSRLRILCAKTRGLFLKNLTFKRKNIFFADVSKADVTFVYLPRELLPNLQNKLQKGLKPGSLVITSRVHFPSWQPVEHTGEIFIYKQT